MTQEAQFKQERGIFVPCRRPHHRDGEYDEVEFDVLLQMQREHFWYRGRHKFILHIAELEIARRFGKKRALKAIDLGGGCGGWLEYLQLNRPGLFSQLALGDSSMRALTLAEPVIGRFAERYQVDLLELPWHEEWDVIFLLDVLEHIPDHKEVMRQVRKSLRPGGLLFVTTPALQFFWTYNDDLAHHQRRYSKQDFRELALSTGFDFLSAEYFMFFLSPALFLNRLFFRPPTQATPQERQNYFSEAHRIPFKPLNEALSGIFSLEASLVDYLSFPWGTSIFTMFCKP